MLRQKEGRLGRWLTAVILTALITAAYLAAGADAKRNYGMINNNGEQMMPRDTGNASVAVLLSVPAR